MGADELDLSAPTSPQAAVQQAAVRPAVAGDSQPGATVALAAEHGGYLPDDGWAPESRTPVSVLVLSSSTQIFACASWVSLDQHLMETEVEARAAASPSLPG